MLSSIWLLLLVYPYAVGAAECLVGCLVQGMSPFVDGDLAVWDDRSNCETNCDVSAVTYDASATSYEGALWASTSDTDTLSDCTCDFCDPDPNGDTITYMEDEASLWSRIQCYVAASEASGYDVSPCVAAINDTNTLACVDEEYEFTTVAQFDCDANDIADRATSSSSVEQCDWDGEVRLAAELFYNLSFSSTAVSDDTITSSCLVGCLLQGISPFDDDSLAVWDNRGTCDSTTIGCEGSAIRYPTTSYDGALWASSVGADGSSDCTCSSICDPLTFAATSYMEEEASLWSRIHCYLVASEASGYDVSPCVAAIKDTETLPCVDDVYEEPTLVQSDCEANLIVDLVGYISVEECTWEGDFRSTDEFFGGTRAPSPVSASMIDDDIAAAAVTPSPTKEKKSRIVC